MFSNFKNPLILFVSSYVLLLVWMLLKISHWPGGDIMFGSMLMVQGIAIVWLIIILARKK